MTAGRDHWWHELMADAAPSCPAEPMDSEDLLYLLYTSGTTAKPKGIMHTPAATSPRWRSPTSTCSTCTPTPTCTGARRHRMGHRPQLHRVRAPRQRLHVGDVRGTPDTCRPEFRSGDRAQWDKDRLWDIIERYGVTQLYTAPTAIRTFMRWGPSGPAATTCRRCGCSARWASRSTPRRGCGTTSTSAAARARSSTPGGRPRRVAT